MKAVVVVESPTKAKTISKYLGSGYQVVASYGHIRDLPAKDGSVRPNEDFAMDWRVVDPKAERRIQDIAKALYGAKQLYLATDPDREGEAISWHIHEELVSRDALLDKVTVKRITFHEITEDAIQRALRNARDLDDELIQAYLARRALDYLVGFTLSPVLWKKLPGSRSAGRVQSVALRLICEREAEIECFTTQEYWTIEADLLTDANITFIARLVYLDGRKLDKLSFLNRQEAQSVAERVMASQLGVSAVEWKKVKRNPPPPFTTATLQQEAARRLRFAVNKTMRTAQHLYEGVEVAGENVGLITYMRTDGVQIANEAVNSIRALINDTFGIAYQPAEPRIYKVKVKNTQEAHEAIRPTDINRHPETLRTFLNDDQQRLYQLIWNRAVASQMKSAELSQGTVEILSSDKMIGLRATGSTLTFDGFFQLYRKSRLSTGDDISLSVIDEYFGTEAVNSSQCYLPSVSIGEHLQKDAIRVEQHFTQPPPRFSEASLVKRLEELGIGRPSTYASILTVLQDRHYVRINDRHFFPEDRGRLVTAFLENYFNRYIQYNFTADLEEQLDDISGGRANWKTVLHQFWHEFIRHVDSTKNLSVSDVLSVLDRELGAHFFPIPRGVDIGHPSRQCPVCESGHLSLKLSRFGAFIGCSNYPTCHYTRSLAALRGTDNQNFSIDYTDNLCELGHHPKTSGKVSLRKGPYGLYIQLDHPTETGSEINLDDYSLLPRKKRKISSVVRPKRVSLPRNFDPATITLATAVALLELPRVIGLHPESGQPITVSIGRFGPYLQHGDVYKTLPDSEDILTISIPNAVTLLSARQHGRASAKTLGVHPVDGQPIRLKIGRYGPYIEHGRRRTTLPKDSDITTFCLDSAMSLLDTNLQKKGKKVRS